MQTELFEMSSPVQTTETEVETTSSVLEKKILTLRLDQTIGIFLVLMVFSVLVFSFGYEKGKHSTRNTQVIKTTQPSVEPVISQAIVEAPSVAERLSAAPAAVVSTGSTELVTADTKETSALSDVPVGKYTIQHVIYKTKSAAERELQNLSKKGQRGFIIPGSKHQRVCISGFQTKKEADAYLKQLRDQKITGTDAFVRNMPV